VHSHDACDGNPYVDGGVNEPCLQSFRHALCRTRVDVVFLTEHAGLMAQGSFERVMQLRDGDEPVTEAGALVGHRIGCADGHRVLLLPGAENELMPLALTRHPDTGAGTLDDAYHTDDAAGVARFRAAGALVAVPHVEQHSLTYLIKLSPNLMESTTSTPTSTRASPARTWASTWAPRYWTWGASAARGTTSSPTWCYSRSSPRIRTT
jgi:hypothetical protein